MGLLPEGRNIARDGAAVLLNGVNVGIVTSGTFSPTLERPIALGLIDAAHAVPGTVLNIDVRGKPVAATVAPLPFVPHRYVRN